VDPRRLSAAGYGEFHPRTSNATAGGRASNRRVDVVVITPAPAPAPASAQATANAPSEPAGD
jgi:chemotaxis protein MotB